jgi:hypothetical protein
MFAIKRNASVPGRIRLLIASIITMNSISMAGVPWGTKCSEYMVGIFDSSGLYKSYSYW